MLIKSTKIDFFHSDDIYRKVYLKRKSPLLGAIVFEKEVQIFIKKRLACS